MHFLQYMATLFFGKSGHLFQNIQLDLTVVHSKIQRVHLTRSNLLEHLLYVSTQSKFFLSKFY